MSLLYYSNFKSAKETSYRVEFHSNIGTHKPEELKLSSAPIIVEWESDTIYQSLKLSNSVVSVLAKRLLTDLYTPETQGVEVRLYNYDNGVIEWFGYVTPCIYTSEYITIADSVDIESIDSLACLDTIKYSYISGKPDFSSFFDIIIYILGKADPNNLINKLYIQDCDKLDDTSQSCLLKDLYINERNFYDEDNEPMTCKEVLSEIASYLGITVIQWRDSYYMVDYNYINDGKYSCTLYNRTLNTESKSTLNTQLLNVMNIGVWESNGSISLDDVYNKVTVTANMNPINNLTPDLFNDEDLKNQNSDPNKYYEQTSGEFVFLSSYFESKNNWTVLTPQINNNGSIEDAGALTPVSAFKLYKGAFFQKNSSYDKNSPEPSSIDWDTYLTFVKTKPSQVLHESYLILKENATLMFAGGYLIIDFSYKLSKSNIADDDYKGVDDMEYTATSEPTKFYCKLKIGDYYYNGEEWLLYSEYLDNISYYSQNIGFEDITGVRKYYKKDSSGNKTYIEKTEYDKIYAQDRFLIVRKNQEHDKVYDTWYNPTNQVSYKENLSDSSDGILIKLPSFSISGNFEIELEPPTVLGEMDSPNGESGGHRVYCRFCHFKHFNAKYTNKKYVYDVFGNVINEMKDIVYENVINESYEIEATEIELLVNTYQNNILSYSNVATKIDGKLDHLKSLYNHVANGDYLPERILIDKLYRHHKAPKFIYSNTLNYKFTPFDMIKENSLNKTMIINSMSINYADDSNQVQLIEL